MTYMIIDISKWKKFRFGDLIEEKNIYKSYAYSRDEMDIIEFYEKNSIPFVSRTEINNSVDCYVDRNGLEHIEKGNALVIGDTTATISYQKDEFVTGDHIVIIRAEWLNEYTGLFICTLLKMEKYRYSYGRAFIINSIKDTELYLPVDSIENVNWKYMEEYIKSLHYDIPKSKNEFKYNNLLDTTDWIDFEVGKLFEKVKVKKHSSTPEINGASPFISSTSLNNGVSTYVADETIPGNCITVSTNGDCFDAFYQEEPIVISSDVEVLYSDFLNKKIAMFICTILEMEKYKWSYGRKPKGDKVFKTVIKLPAKKGENQKYIIDYEKVYSDEGYIPDFKYMEDFINGISYGDIL